jgi:hypothetical protein
MLTDSNVPGSTDNLLSLREAQEAHRDMKVAGLNQIPSG